MTPLIQILSHFVVGILVYRFWEPFVNPPRRETPEGTATLYFFYTDWCGHSKKAMLLPSSISKKMWMCGLYLPVEGTWSSPMAWENFRPRTPV